MRRILSVTLLLLFPASLVVAAPPKRADLPANTKSMVHIDIDAIQKKQIGRDLIEQVFSLPSLKKQLAELPESLAFLKQVKFHDVTVLSFDAEEGDSSVVVVAQLDYDQAHTLEVLQSARDYAEVSYHGVAIHQWRANMNALGDKLLERQRTEEQKNEDKFEPVFVATVNPSTVIVSTSLKQLTGVLDRRLDRCDMIDAARFQRWTRLTNCLVHVAYDMEEEGFPSNVVAQLCVQSDEKVTIAAESFCRSEQEKQVGRMIANVMNNFEQYRDFVAGFLPKMDDETAEATTEGKSSESSEDDVQDNSQVEEPSKGKRNGKLTFAVSVDDKNAAKDEDKSSTDWVAEIGKLVSRTATASFEDDVLKIKAEAYPDRWKVELKSEGNDDIINIKLNLFSSKAKYLAAGKKAGQKATIRR